MTRAASAQVPPTLQCTLHYERIPGTANLAGLSEVFSQLAWPAILGGNPRKAGGDGFSYWAATPVEIVRIDTSHPDPVGLTQQVLDRYQFDGAGAEDLPHGLFCGGWIGFFSYDLGRYIEPRLTTPKDDLGMPLVQLAFYDRVVAYDHARRAVWLMALHLPADDDPVRDKIESLRPLLDRSSDIQPACHRATDFEHPDLTRAECNTTPARYLEAIAQIQRHVLDGDVYQVNLSQRFSCPFLARGVDLFHWENAVNPSPYAAYIDSPPFQIVSASPEMFLTVSRGSIRTKPIKGTRPRIAGATAQARQANRKAYHELAASMKEQAELAMIVDLERNDLARVCVPGTRRVLVPRTIEAYPSVFHAVAVVGGRLRPDVRFGDILKATFPGGSITGAPKIRAMEIIDEFEPCARGLYTGSIGFIGVDGTACLNIAIRTIIIAGHTAHVQVGGGIVADSDPQAEYEETLVKARALLAGIQQVEGLRRGAGC
jgi:para-aminobenzoate synthetase component 1